MKTSERGYGSAHQRLRRQVARLVDTGQAVCWRCGQEIMLGQPWDLGHMDGDRLRYAGPEHRHCNRSTAAHRRRTSRPW